MLQYLRTNRSTGRETETGESAVTRCGKSQRDWCSKCQVHRGSHQQQDATVEREGSCISPLGETQPLRSPHFPEMTGLHILPA